MVWISYGIGIASLFFLVLGGILVVGKQFRTSSLASYYFLSIIVCIMGWVICNMLVVISSQLETLSLSKALFCSRFATIISMVGMVATVLFVRTISQKRAHNPYILAITLFLFGGVFGLTVSSDYEVVHQLVKSGNYYFAIAKTSIIWVIFDAGLALFAGSVFLFYLIKQHNFAEKRYRRTVEIMIVGVIIAYFVSALIFAIRKILYAITDVVMLLHFEYIAVAAGALIIGISIYLGGIEAFYYSTEVHVIYIFDKDGTSIYSASAKKAVTLRGHSVLGVIAAFSEFAGELVGKDVYPKEIDLGDNCLMIETQGNFVCFLSSKISTAYLRQAIKKLLTNLTHDLKEENISALVEKYFAFKPRVSKPFE